MRRLLPPLTLSIAAGSVALTSTAALASPPRACPGGLHRAVTAELSPGRDPPRAPGEVSDADWTQFVDNEITPRFPAGLSVSDVYGQWRSPQGQFEREQTKALFLVLTGSSAERQSLDLVRDAYKQRFHQNSVMLVEQQACVGVLLTIGPVGGNICAWPARLMLLDDERDAGNSPMGGAARRWAVGLALLALFLQGVTPAGFMVAREDGRATIVICTGHGAAHSLEDLAGHPAKAPKSRPDAPCAFAGHGVAAPPPLAALIASPIGRP